jgi:hypothetical protein
MNGLPDQELLLNDFAEHLRHNPNFSPTKVSEFRLAAKQFIEYLDKIHGDQWPKHVQNEQKVSAFINAKFQGDSDETRNTKENGVRKFQDYLKGPGRVAFGTYLIESEKRRPWIRLLSILIGGIIILITFFSYFGWTPQTIIGYLNPSDTPTVTNTPSPTKTPTITLTPSPT